MCYKLHKKDISLALTKFIALFVIVTVNSYPSNPYLCFEENLSQLLRPASYQNGGNRPVNFLSAPAGTPSDSLERLEGFETIVYTYEGVTDFVNFGVDGEPLGVPTFVPPDTFVKSTSPATVKATGTGKLSLVPDDFKGTDFDVIKGQYWALHLIMQRQFENLPELKNNKFIEFVVDLLPDLTDPAQKKLVEAILEAIANRMLQYKRDRRFERAGLNARLYIDFVSKKGNNVKAEKIKELFKKLRVVEGSGLDKLTQSAPAGTALTDKVIITYQGDPVRPEYPPLVLQKEVFSGGKIMAYPWHTIIDLSVEILTIDRTAENIQNEPAYAVIKELLQCLTKADITDGFLSNFLSNRPEVAVKAAYQLVLPPVREVDLGVVEDINRITIEAAKWA